MEGSEESRRGLGEPLLPARGDPQRLSQEVSGEQLQDEPQLSPPHREDEKEEEEESQHTKGWCDGVLDEDTVAEGLNRLGRSAHGTEYVYLNLSLSGHGLSDISILCGYVHLQKLELSYNKINDLSCVSHMPYLLQLDASHNELTTYFAFKPPKNLKEVDFSYNQILKMEDLSAHQSLTKLLLDFNNIEEIRGLEKCHSLTHLSLSHNRLVAISGLKDLPIKILNLSSNRIEKITGLDSLKTLRKLDLSSNKITSLEGLKKHDLLEVINLEDNKIAVLHEIERIKDLPLLRVLNLLKNPVQDQTGYWLSVIFLILQLTELDLKKISVEEKVAAMNKYDPPPEVIAAGDHMTNVMNSMRQPQRIFDSTSPSLDIAYAMVVLVGPLACGKRELTHEICREFNSFFRYGPCHTTRPAYSDEVNRLDYHFVSQEAFDNMVKTGKFIATYKYSGYYYGLGRDTVESIAREGLATFVHLEIEGVRSLKNTYFKPRYFLLVPMNKEKYEERLWRKGLFSRPEIEEAVSRVDMYIKISQDFPGYFDAVVNTDELDEALRELSLLVKSYLGLDLPAHSESVQDFNSREGAGSRLSLLQEQELSASGGITETIRPSHVTEFLDSSAKNYPGDTSDKLAAQLGSVEEASFQRRYSAARQALSEKAPSAYVEMFQRVLTVTPPPSSSHQELLKPTTRVPLLSGRRNVAQDQSFSLTNPESCYRKSGPASGLFQISAVKPTSQGQPVRIPVPQKNKAENQDPRGPENGAGRLKETEIPAENLQRIHGKSRSGSSQVPQLVNWPGPSSKPVLPPVPPGWKKTNP